MPLTAAECVSDHGKIACENLGGQCVTERDGYYIVSAVCLGIGVLSVIFHMIPTARKLQGKLRTLLVCACLINVISQLYRRANGGCHDIYLGL